MLVVLNIFILLVLLGLIAIWSTYGVFSALLHLIIVVAAGTIAFAVWEPLAFWLLGRMPAYAHGVGLLAPFTLLIIFFRALFDRLCRMNVHVPRIADQIGGGVCGLLSGILAIGVLLIGVNFLPAAKDAMGWEPYKIEANKVVANPEGQLWSFLRVHKTAGSFFTMLSGGSMSPMGSDPGMSEARPNVAERAMRSRSPYDTNQFRSAHPDTISVVGLYELPATAQGFTELSRRATVVSMLNPGYALAADLRSDDPEKAAVLDAVLTEYFRRTENAPPEAEIGYLVNSLLNTDLIESSAQTEVLQLNNPTTPENFPTFIQLAVENNISNLSTQLSTVMGEGKRVLLVDTLWNNDTPGTYDTDNTLRVAIPQVRLQVRTRSGLVDVEPIGYSIEYSQNNYARRFTELLSQQIYSADSDDAKFHMGWAFVIDNDDEPERFFVRGLRFELDELEDVTGTDSPINRNLDDVARVIGAPPLPVPPADRLDIMTTGMQIGDTGTYADISEGLPGVFSGSAANVDVDREAEPWTLIRGTAERLPRGTGGRNSRVRNIQVSERERLVRIKLDAQVAQAFLGQATGVGSNQNTMYVLDDGGNLRPAIGYAHLTANNEMTIDIRDEFQGRGSRPSLLPRLREGELLFIYFEAPLDSKVVGYQVGEQILTFTPQPLEVTDE